MGCGYQHVRGWRLVGKLIWVRRVEHWKRVVEWQRLCGWIPLGHRDDDVRAQRFEQWKRVVEWRARRRRHRVGFVERWRPRNRVVEWVGQRRWPA